MRLDGGEDEVDEGEDEDGDNGVRRGRKWD